MANARMARLSGMLAGVGPVADGALTTPFMRSMQQIISRSMLQPSWDSSSRAAGWIGDSNWRANAWPDTGM